MGYTIWPDGSTGDVLQAVYRERLRQEELMAKGKFYWTCSSSHRSVAAGSALVTNSERLAVLAEEFGEVGREVTEEIIARDREKANNAHVTAEAMKVETKRLREELIQLAAVAVAWAEAL